VSGRWMVSVVAPSFSSELPSWASRTSSSPL
jgi:hypothetical protein